MIAFGPIGLILGRLIQKIVSGDGCDELGVVQATWIFVVVSGNFIIQFYQHLRRFGVMCVENAASIAFQQNFVIRRRALT